MYGYIEVGQVKLVGKREKKTIIYDTNSNNQVEIKKRERKKK